MRYILLCIIIVIVTDFVAFIAYAIFPDHRIYFIDEDSFIENITAGIFCCVFIIALAYLILKNTRYRSPSSPWWLVIIGSLGLLAFLDEISFGERIFDFKMPIVAGVKIDAAHDFVELVYLNANELIDMHSVLFYFIALCSLTLLVIFILSFRKNISSPASNYPIYVLLCFCIIFVLSATMIDAIGVEVIGRAVGLNRGHIMAIEEILELNAAVVLLVAVLMVAHTTPLRYQLPHIHNRYPRRSLPK